jgi:insulysin
VPKARVIVEMRTPVAIESPIASVLTKYVDNMVRGLGLPAEYRYRLYASLVADALNEYSYDAELAGLNYLFEASSLGFFVTITGYNDKLHVLLRDVLVKVKDLEVRADRLNVMIEKVNDVSPDTRLITLTFFAQTKRDWENFFLGQTYQLSDYYGRYLITERQWTILEKLQALGCKC